MKIAACKPGHICEAAQEQAQKNDIDPAFFIKLLWRESLFDPNVVSYKGAQGIAQFMPETAAKRGLKDPFEPLGAVAASAVYLSELRKLFGNLGLAAAAYNAGELRVQKWLDADGGLPQETRDYVLFITGRPAEDWKSPTAEFAIPPVGKGTVVDDCVDLALRKTQLATAGLKSAPPQAWGAVIAVNFSESKAVAQFRRLKLRFPAELANRDPLIVRKRNLSRGTRKLVYVMIGQKSSASALAACESLSAAGAPCLVRKN